MPWRHDTLPRSPIGRLLAWAATRSASTALLCESETISYGDLVPRIQAAAAWLYHGGVRQGHTVAYALVRDAHNTSRQVAMFYGLQWLGAVVLPLYDEVPIARHGHLARQFGADWLLSANPIDDSCPPRLDPTHYAEQAAQWAGGHAAPRADDPLQPLVYEFTSGTTGTPKAMLFTGEQYTAKVLVTAQRFGWQTDDAMVLPLRWPSKVGVKGMLRVLILGATYVDAPFPETRHQLDQLIRHQGVSCLGSTPWQLRRLLASPAMDGPQPRQLRVLGTAGAFIAPHEIEAVRNTLAANFHVGYGSTEIGAMGHLPPEDPATGPFRAIPGMQVQAVDAQGHPTAAGQAGRLCFRAPWLPTAFANHPAASLATFQDGWFISSDVGLVDARGNIKLLGRSDEAINVGGSKIQPLEVEQALLLHPDIADAAVLGVPNTMAGEIAIAFLVLRRALTLEEIVSFLNPRLDSWQLPTAVLVIGQIPRSPEGKILRAPLRAAYTQFMASQPPVHA